MSKLKFKQGGFMEQMCIIIVAVLSAFLCTFTVISIVLVGKIRSLRQRINTLLEENAQKTTELDNYIQAQKNPLGPLMTKTAKSLIVSFNRNGIITKVNDELLRLFGFTSKELIGKNMIGTVLPTPEKEKYNIIKRIFANPKLFIDCETQAQTKNKKTVWISWTNRFVYDKNDRPISVSAVGFDISRRKSMEAELQYLSTVDPQTGVLNRTALIEVGSRELKRAMRYHRSLSVAIVKLKHKNIFDAMSDDFTDAVLHDIIQMCRKVMRSVDYLGRIGDIEFAMILPETQISNLPFLIKRLNEHIDAYNKGAGLKDAIDLVYGGADYTKDSDTIDSLLSAADVDLNKKEKKLIQNKSHIKRRHK